MASDNNYFSAGTESPEPMNASSGRTLALHSFADSRGLGHVRVKYFRNGGPGRKWRLYLLGLTVGGDPSYGWGEELEDAYRAYVANIKGQWARINDEEEFIPGHLTVY